MEDVLRPHVECRGGRGFEADPVPCALCHEICKLAKSAQVLQIDVLRVATSNHRRVLLLGEDHGLTHAFAEKMIERLRALLLLLKRHIYGSADVLSCDQRGIAMHALRCAPFLQEKPCHALDIVWADSRHVDLGGAKVAMSVACESMATTNSSSIEKSIAKNVTISEKRAIFFLETSK